MRKPVFWNDIENNLVSFHEICVMFVKCLLSSHELYCYRHQSICMTFRWSGKEEKPLIESSNYSNQRFFWKWTLEQYHLWFSLICNLKICPLCFLCYYIVCRWVKRVYKDKNFHMLMAFAIRFHLLFCWWCLQFHLRSFQLNRHDNDLCHLGWKY